MVSVHVNVSFSFFSNILYTIRAIKHVVKCASILSSLDKVYNGDKKAKIKEIYDKMMSIENIEGNKIYQKQKEAIEGILNKEEG